MKRGPIISVVIGSFNRFEFLKATIDTVRRELADTPHELFIVDGGSNDGTAEWLVQQKDIIAIIQHNRGEWRGQPIERKSWGYFMNLGFRAATGKYVCMLSDDCLIVPGAIKNGLQTFEDALTRGEKVGQIALYWRNWPEQKNYWVGLAWGNRMFVNHGIYLREALEKVNYIDADSFFFYHADGDLSLRLWDAGYACIDSPRSFIEHYSDANTEVRTSNMERQQQDWNTYTERWKHLEKPKKDWIEQEFTDTTDTAEKYWKPTENKSKGNVLTRIFK